MNVEPSKTQQDNIGPDQNAGGGWRNWLPFVLGLLLAVAALEYIRQNVVFKLEEAALGRDTQNSLVTVNGVHVHCLVS